MNKKDLLKELMKKYSFEKSYSIIQIVSEDGEFENSDIKIIMTRTLKSDLFNLEWKVYAY